MYTRLPVPQDLLDFIQNGSSFIIAGHQEPDGDCIGSQLALGTLLERLGKQVTLLSAGPWKRAEVLRFKDRFAATFTPDAGKPAPRLIVTDCSSMDRLGDIEKSLQGLSTAFIDHHKTNAVSGVRYINPEAPATASLVLALWETFGEPLSREAAGYLLLSLCTDTGFFRHIDEGGAETLADAHKLVAAGGSLKKTFAAINGGRSLASRQLLGTVLGRAESHYGGRLIVTTEELAETERFGRENRDSDTLYQLLQAVEGVEAIAVVRQDTKDSCAVGLRSRDAVDVSAIAAELGGGGHKNASGAYVDGHIPAIKARVTALFARCFSD